MFSIESSTPKNILEKLLNIDILSVCPNLPKSTLIFNFSQSSSKLVRQVMNFPRRISLLSDKLKARRVSRTLFPDPCACGNLVTSRKKLQEVRFYRIIVSVTNYQHLRPLKDIPKQRSENIVRQSCLFESLFNTLAPINTKQEKKLDRRTDLTHVYGQL